MILTPKNWKSFQHYKDRAPSWIKLHKGLLDDFEFVCLPIASRALAPMLWLLASEYEGGQIDASLEKIAFRVHLSVEELRGALSPLIDSGFFEASEVLAQPLAGCLPREEDIEKRKRKEDIRAATPSKNEDFENLKKVYPKRNGNYGWKAAERKFNSLVKTGVDPKIIIGAASRFAANAGSKVGTEFIPMPASWLNSEDFVECAVTAFEPKDDGLIEVLDQWALDAWSAYERDNGLRPSPRNKRGGWRFPTKWPPGYEPQANAEPISMPRLRSM